MRKHLRYLAIAFLNLAFLSLSISSAQAVVVYPKSGGPVDLAYSKSGSISNTDCSIPSRGAGYYVDIYKVSSSASTRLYLKGVTLSDPFIQVVRSDRTTVFAVDDDSGAGRDSYLNSLVVTTDDYIVATTYNAGATGSYLLHSDVELTQVCGRQDIVFDQPAPFSYGDTLSVSATTNMSLPVTLTSLTTSICSATSTGAANFLISSLDVGTCTVRASQPGNGLVEAAPNVYRNITINKRTVGLTGLNGNKDYDGTTSATLTGTAALNAANIVGSDDVTLTGTPSGTFNSPNAGSRTITISGLNLAGAQANRYQLNTSLAATINRISQTITWNPNQILVPSDTGKMLAAAVSSGDGAITYSIVNAGTTACSISGRTLNFSGQGNCTVRATAAQSTNYDSTFQDATVIISKLNQVISWSPTTSISASPTTQTFSAATTSGNGSISYSITDAGATGCSVSGTSLSFASVGTCKVRASAASTTDYNSDNVEKSFIISLVPQSVTWTPTNITPLVTESPLVPNALPVATSSGAITYSISNSGTSDCTVDSSTGELTFSKIGVCRVKATSAETATESQAYSEVDFTISPISQVVSWTPEETSMDLSSNKFLPTPLASTTGSGSISYSIQSNGGTSCTVNSVTAEITYSAIGKCVVRASAAATDRERSAFLDVQFEVKAAPAPALQAPSKPLNLTATIVGDQVTLKWMEPKDLVANSSNTYIGTLAAGSDILTCETKNLECIITGIKRNVAYDATVIAKNSAGNSADSNSVRVFSPEIIEVTQGTKIPPTFEPSASSLGLSPLGASAQDQLVKLGIVDAPATTTIVVVSNDLTNNKFDVETLTNSSKKIAPGAAIGIKLTPPADTPAGTVSYAYVKAPDGNWILLGSAPVVGGVSVSLPPMSFVFPGAYEILWTLKAPANYQPLGFLKFSQASIFRAVNAAPELGMHTVRLAVTVEKGSAELPTLTSATPTPTPTPTEVVETPAAPEPVVTTPETTDAPAAGEVVAFSPLDNPAGVADTAVTALALAAAAGAAAGAAGSRSGGGGSSGGGSQGEESGNDEGSLSTIDIQLTGHESEKLGIGDRFKIWTLPIMNFLDRPSHKAGVNSAEYSPLVSKFIIDGAYLRAMFGSLTLLATFFAMGLGTTSAIALDGDILPPPALVLGIIAVIGVFDALSGFLGMFTFAITALVLADERTAGDIRMLMGIVLLGFGPVLLANGARNFRGESSYSGEYIWERITDVAVGAFLAGWSASAMVSVLPALAGLTLPIADSAKAIGLAVAIATIVRIAAEEAAARLFPARLNELHPTEVDDSSLIQKMIALGLRAGVFLFVAAAFIGYEWYLFVGTLLFIIPSYLGLFADRVPNNPTLFQLIPAGLPGLIFSLALGALTVGLISSVLGDDPLLAKLSFVLVPIPVFIVAILSLIGREPREGDVRWYERDNFKLLYRVGGAVAFFTVLKMTGILA
jgi:hypothetical protein